MLDNNYETYYGMYNIYIYILYCNDGTYYVKCLVLFVFAGDIYSSLVLVSELLDAMVRLQGELI